MVGVRRFDEEEVLGRAEAVFRSHGYEATSMLDLSRATGVQRGSLYNAYGDKEELFLRTFARYEARFLATAAEALSAPDVRAGLAAFFDAAIANMTAGPARGCLSTRLASEGDAPGPRVCGEVRALLLRLEQLLQDAFARAAPPPVLPPAAAARMVITFTRGLAVMERVHGDPAALAATAADVVDLLLPPPPSA
ncbi:MAG: hypothetical protein B7X99_00025 [Rhizobiales bacterium 17-65-6]|nr:MAG: hypothetical protein B7Y84_16585 [Azorhizobium sp. 32-67-21]OZA01590.1 MAG: hypothetical protein B7X99_00025 [Rhizobiales bacterium 17-65-6]